jgi:hypothetical protein
MIDDRTAERLRRRVKRLLRDIDCLEPPVEVEDVLEHLELHRSYYDLENPSFAREIQHKAKLTLQKVKNVVTTVNLRALWLPDESKVFLDNGLHDARVKYTTAHEIGHQLNPHHHDYFAVGDTALTLDPYYHEALEQEAHFAGGELVFMGEMFTKDARDCALGFDAIEQLKKRYDNSFTSTFRRYAVRSTDAPMAAVIGTPAWDASDGDRSRHFVRNPAFEAQFPAASATYVLAQVDMFVRRRKWGVVGEGEMNLADANGDLHQFDWSSFFNQHDMLTLVTYRAPVRTTVGFGL